MGRENWYGLLLLDKQKAKALIKMKCNNRYKRESLPKRYIIMNLCATWNIQSENGMIKNYKSVIIVRDFNTVPSKTSKSSK